MRPAAAPGDAGRPVVIGSASISPARLAWKNSARSSGRTEWIADAIAAPVPICAASLTAVVMRRARSPLMPAEN
jgi:hypothetical protein